MDVHCSSCDKPWDVYHLWHDAIFQTELPEAEALAWFSLPTPERLSDRYREAFRTVGWEFGRTVVNIIWCPHCPKGAEPATNRVATKAALEELFVEDEETLAELYENYRL